MRSRPRRLLVFGSELALKTDSTNETNSSEASVVISVINFCLCELSVIAVLQEQFEDNRRVIRSRKSKKSRQYNCQKKGKKTNSDLQNIHIKLKIEITRIQ
jgi:uncharacterized protein YgiM (DUF1202 family)